MGAIRETLTLEDAFSANFTRYINLGRQAAGASDLASQAVKNYQSVANSLDRRLISLNAQFSAGMQRQQAMVAAGQQNTKAFADLDNKLEKLGETIRDTEAQYKAVTSQMEKANEAAKKAALSTESLSKKQSSAKNSSDSLARSLRTLLGGYLGLQGVQGLLNLSDTFSSNTARLNMMNDGMQTTAELQNAIFLAAQRSRGTYLETTNLVAKLGTLTDGVFDSNQQLVAFAEQLNKQIALSGASTQAADAAMLQLTQALSSGALRGEELNSILKQTPTIAQTIADYMGVTTGKMRELASEGAITADVVKNALLSASEETNEAFEKMPMTWGQVWNSMQNIAIKAMEPVLSAVNFLANSVDVAVQWVLNNMALVEPILAALAAGAIALGVYMVVSGIAAVAAWSPVTWTIIAIAAAVGALIFIARQAGATWQEIGAFIGGVLGALYANAMNNCIVPLQRGFAALANFLGNVFNNPVAAIQILFFDMALTVLGYIKNVAQGIENLINKIPGLSVDITSGIDSVYNMVQQASQKVKDESGWKEYVKAWDFVDYGGAIQGGSKIGANLGTSLDNFNLESAISNLAGGLGSGGGASIPSYEELLKQADGLGSINDSLSGIGDSVSGIEKEVSMSDEDLKNLVDMAERQYVANVNLTSQTPVINITGANTGNTAADRKAIADAIQVVLMEQLSSTSVRATAMPA